MAMYHVQSAAADIFEPQSTNEAFSTEPIDVLAVMRFRPKQKPYLLPIFAEFFSQECFCPRSFLTLPVQLHLPITSIGIPKLIGFVDTAIPNMTETAENAVLSEILNSDKWANPLPSKDEVIIKGRITSIEQGVPSF